MKDSFIVINRPFAASILLSLALLLYIVIRAVNISFTHDESFTFLRFVNGSFWDIFFNQDFWDTANNHPLNTLSMQLAYKLFGAKEWALRLGSIAGGFVFFIYIIRIVCLWLPTSSWYFFGACCVFMLNPFLIEYFSVCRGYGLSMGFEIAGLFYFFRWIKNESKFDLLKIGCCFSLGILSNFTLLDLMMAFFLIASFAIYIKSRNSFSIIHCLKLLAIPAIPFLLTLALIFQPIHWIKSAGEFHFGPVSFWETWRVLIQRFVYNPYPTSLWTIVPILLVSTLFFVFIVRAIFIRYKNFGIKANASLFYSALLTLSTIVITIVLYFLFDTHYPVGRTALLFYPLLSSVVTLYLIDFIVPWKKANLLLVILILGLSINFILQANISYVREWHYEKNTKAAVLYANAQGSQLNKIKYGVSWTFIPTTLFYKHTLSLDNIEFPKYMDLKLININNSHEDSLRLKSEPLDIIYIPENLLPLVKYQYVLEKRFEKQLLMRKR